MKIYDEAQTDKLYRTSLKSALEKLSKIEVFCGNKQNFWASTYAANK